METIQTQIAFYFNTDFKKDFEILSLSIKELFGHKAQTILIPIPKDEPSEIPRLILQYDKFKINVSKNRLDIFTSEDITAIYQKIIYDLFDRLNIKIIRIGFVKTFFLPSKIDDLKKILNEKLQSISYKEISLRLGIEITCKGFKCNNIEKIDFGQAQKFENGKIIRTEGQIIQRDINTSPENSDVIPADKIESLIQEFMNIAHSRIINIK
ncbi:hypothetical protein [Deferrisoma camini]|uniref:hypothetical protein n=1 Tax=Deferrisoma camini TaxID=1035120 RepID=UPI00146A686A|nr:hypothetical protein [Deferrisoma camini]